ncbi:MAG: selenide, water dikinase SelD [Acidimicrobiales bacterium]
MAEETIRLTEWTSCGGCAAKWGGASLASLVGQLASAGDRSLLVGLAPFDDAAVYLLAPDLALVSTTDFFPPLVDDPADFGAIAAANACSDVYAMGGRVVLALNIAAFPEQLPEHVVVSILDAAAEVVAQAGGTVAGGHTIRSEEPIFGLAVQGLVHPDRIWTKGGARPGDRLVLSKPVGSGIVLAGGSPEAKAEAILVMRSLNRHAADQLASVEPHAVTDVTGFGVLGHAWEMASRSGASISILASQLPLYPGALEAATAGTRTGGDGRNRAYLAGSVTVTDVAPEVEALAYDPQTSGGLLAAVGSKDAAALVEQGWWDVGRVAEGRPSVALA